MKNEKFLLVVAVGAVMAGCHHEKARELTANELYAIQKGYEAAEQVLSLPKGSVEQEKALLAIRAREERIKAAGDTLAAEAFVSAVEEKLDSAGLLSRGRHN
ncbi:MAG: hypothetical protein LIP03_08050 [Bacteroidales bacterium]|nr:hypothetical protein [Bacteroidales bacterium]